MASKLLFIGGALKAPPPATPDAFQMLPQVGLKIFFLNYRRSSVSSAFFNADNFIVIHGEFQLKI